MASFLNRWRHGRQSLVGDNGCLIQVRTSQRAVRAPVRNRKSCTWQEALKEPRLQPAGQHQYEFHHHHLCPSAFIISTRTIELRIYSEKFPFLCAAARIGNKLENISFQRISSVRKPVSPVVSLLSFYGVLGKTRRADDHRVRLSGDPLSVLTYRTRLEACRVVLLAVGAGQSVEGALQRRLHRPVSVLRERTHC
jgi:hypothetical protein